MFKSKKLLSSVLVVAMIASMGTTVFASQTNNLPETILRGGKEYTLVANEPNSAVPDNIRSTRAYAVLASDVGLYIDYSHGHGGDYFASGYVTATAPRFTARAEVRVGSTTLATSGNKRNNSDTANATTHLTVGLVDNATPRIFYAW